jgi:stage III sporulation protein SpoIIIAA
MRLRTILKRATTSAAGCLAMHPRQPQKQRMAGMGAKPGAGDVMARMAREYAETVVVVREVGIRAD